MCHSDFLCEVTAQRPLRSPSRGVEVENQYTVKNDVSSLRLHTQSQYSFLNTVHTSKGKGRHSEKGAKLLRHLSFRLRSRWAPFSANFWFRSAYCRLFLFFSLFFKLPACAHSEGKKRWAQRRRSCANCGYWHTLIRQTREIKTQSSFCARLLR